MGYLAVQKKIVIFKTLKASALNATKTPAF
jgi:hypothetical protein